jgi:hypothetical protein
MKAQVKQHNGTPTLFLNDKPVFANIQWTGFLNPETIGPIQTAIRGFAGTGVHIYTTDTLAAEWHGPSIGEYPTSLVAHFIESFAVTARANVHARVLYGRDDHHQAEALFKALGRALDAATCLDPRRAGSVPSTKGTL